MNAQERNDDEMSDNSEHSIEAPAFVQEHQTDPLGIKPESGELFNQILADTDVEEVNNLAEFNCEEITDEEGDSMFLYYDSKDCFNPIKSALQSKHNDKLSGSLPFALGVSYLLPSAIKFFLEIKIRIFLNP